LQIPPPLLPKSITCNFSAPTLSYIQPGLWQFKHFPIETMVIFSNFHKYQLNIKFHLYIHQRDHPCAGPRPLGY